MADELKIEKVVVVSSSTRNGAPISGDVTFSDGKCYDWSMHTDETRFHTSRKMQHGGFERFSFSSPKRAKLLTDWLNNNDWSVFVFRVS